MSSYVLLGELCNFFFGVLWKESLRLESPVLSEIGGGHHKYIVGRYQFDIYQITVFRNIVRLRVIAHKSAKCMSFSNDIVRGSAV